MAVSQIKVLFIIIVSLFTIIKLSSSQANPPHPCEGKPKSTIVHDPNCCRNFFICNGKDKGEALSCLKRYYMNLRTEKCEFDNDRQYKCIKSLSFENVCSNSDPDPDIVLFHPYQCDCTRYIQCSNGQPYNMDCPAGLHFNNALEVCDWPANAGCNEAR